MRQAAGERASEGFQVCETDCPPRIGGQRDREADPARGGSCTKGNFWILLPPRRFAPPLLFQEGSRKFPRPRIRRSATAPYAGGNKTVAATRLYEEYLRRL